MLNQVIAKFFASEVRARGNSYASAGFVSRFRVSGDSISASVHGSSRYTVTIDRTTERDGWRLDVACTCPYAADNDDRCKHVWAVFKAGDAQIARAWGPTPGRVAVYGQEGGGPSPDDDVYDGEVIDRPRAVAPSARPADLVRLSIEELRAQLRRAEAAQRQRREHSPKPPKPKIPAWKRMLDETRPYAGMHRVAETAHREPIDTPLWYILDAARTKTKEMLVVELARHSHTAHVVHGALPTKVGQVVAQLKKVSINLADLSSIADETDRTICGLLVGAARPGRESTGYGYGQEYHRTEHRAAQWQIDPRVLPMLMARMSSTGRLLMRSDEHQPPTSAAWAPDRPWQMVLNLREEREVPQFGERAARAARHVIDFALRRGDEHLGSHEAAALTTGSPGVVLHNGEAAPLRLSGSSSRDLLPWIRSLAWRPPVAVRREELAGFLDGLAKSGVDLPVVWPKAWEVERVTGVTPRPVLVLRAYEGRSSNLLRATVQFEYDGVRVDAGTGSYAQKAAANGVAAMIERDVALEGRAETRFLMLGGKRETYGDALTVASKAVPKMAASLIAEGWSVLGDAHAYRAPGKVSVRVSSGIDWFDLEGGVEFGDGGASAAIGDVLAALAKGEKFVKLGDGSLGLLPEEWLSRHARWLALGRVEGESVRFGKAQLTLVDALLAEMPEATCDARVAAARTKLRRFEGIAARTEPKDFKGTLRPYQRDGLGWLHFLAEFGLGGCLADDMGLGKTVQLLAHMAERRALGGKDDRGPWLVVAPKTLVFNWAREAERFTPGLRIVDHTGLQRGDTPESLQRADLVLTTYATMRMDIELLRKVDFACAVLDEAQAIKNEGSQGAKAARLLKARRRIALTGTPVENRLEDLWSIFEFLNPGMLGSSGAFKEAARSGGSATGAGNEGAGVEVLRRALRPFLLRRTKAKVAPDLPARSEQTVRCELEGSQRALYDGLREHYRQQLLGRVEREGMKKSQMHVLEALLRLRQAACHAALVDSTIVELKPMKSRGARMKKAKGMGTPEDAGARPGDSAKVATLVEMLEELGAEGHKALVFSQFTSLLALVKRELNRRKIAYEELDGSTSAKEREARVDRFQRVATKDGGRGVFLISLKAGGVGLNLTAAGYVFLLDPWWNPAVEAQAIDRTHRIGQDKSVIAYRLIATGTVEERILELQQRKRELAEAIVSENTGPLAAMTREDLEWLLS